MKTAFDTYVESQMKNPEFASDYQAALTEISEKDYLYQSFKNYIVSNLNLDCLDFLLFEISNIENNSLTLGVIYCDSELESADLHCEQCKNEILPIRVQGPNHQIPNYLTAYVGPTKFSRIKSGWRNSEGLDLNKVRFLRFYNQT